MTVHLVNLTNPMMMKGPVREVIPLSGQKLRVTVPTGASIRGVRLLVSTAQPTPRTRGRDIELDLPPIAMHEVVAIDL
jgi:hypothetical protein